MLMAFAGLLCLVGSVYLIWAGKPGGPPHAPHLRRRALGELYTMQVVSRLVLSAVPLAKVALG
jgi:hypothetical protein